MTEKFCIGIEAAQENISKFVEQGQWGVIGVMNELPFAYTVGLHSLGLSELIIYGLPSHELASGVLSCHAQMTVDQSAPFKHGEAVAMLEKYPLIIIDCNEESKQKHALQAYNFYRHWDFGLQQIVWPDVNNILPWADGCNAEVIANQSILGERP